MDFKISRLITQRLAAFHIKESFAERGWGETRSAVEDAGAGEQILMMEPQVNILTEKTLSVTINSQCIISALSTVFILS